MKEAKDALRILIALVFITLAAMASVDKDVVVEVSEPQRLSAVQSSVQSMDQSELEQEPAKGTDQVPADAKAAEVLEKREKPQRRTWASLLLEVLQRIV